MLLTPQIKKIPATYLEEFIKNYYSLIKNRVKLLCFLALGIYSIATLISYFLFPRSFKIEEIPLFSIFIIGSIFIIYFANKASSLKTTKITAYIFVLLILIFITAIAIVYYQYIEVSSALYLFVLFLVAFTIPWSPIEVIPISALHILSYSVLFIYAKDMLLTSGVRINFERYADGILFLSLGCAFCMIIRRKEIARDIQNFILLKEIESKNQQMQKELELATRIHKTLIPNSVSTDLVDIAVSYLPMYYMGGDYAKFRFIDNDKLIFIICDVTGHGVSAALLVNRFHAEFEHLAREGKNPGLLLKELNNFILESFQGINMYLSAFCGLLDFKQGKFIYSNHGHPTQYIYRISNSEIKLLPSQTSLLGLPIKEEGTFEQIINFKKGERILLFTDGVTEARDKSGQVYGEEKLEEFIRNNYGLQVESFNQKLLNALNLFNQGPFNDDIFILNIYLK